MKSVIEVTNLSKSYTIGSREACDNLREEIMQIITAPFKRLAGLSKPHAQSHMPSDTTLWVLKDVSFEVQEGDVIGIIGRNGAGKSTLLKILSRITEPTSGRVVMRGRVASLLEVGTGFHPELTGRENIFLNGALLGMSRQEIKSKFDEIVAFSEIEKFLDTPVKRYSSGMYVRLAFAVAAHLESEILIIDEVLAVGDSAFQKKCLGKMEDVAKGGRTVLFVSHNMAAVENLCTKAVLIVNGKLIQSGLPKDIISFYLLSSTQVEEISEHLNKRPGSGRARVIKLIYIDSSESQKNTIKCGESINIVIQYKVFKELYTPVVAFTIYNSLGVAVSNFISEIFDLKLPSSIGIHQVACKIKELNLAPGKYYLNIAMKDAKEMLDRLENTSSFSILPSDYLGIGKLPSERFSIVVMKHDWEII